MTSTTIMQIDPQDIEAESFRIIAEEFSERTSLQVTDLDPARFKIIQRVIHATGDFNFAQTLEFHPDAIATAIQKIKAGKNILTDVTMSATGISKPLLAPWGGSVLCKLGDQDIAEQAKASGMSRSETAIARGLQENIGIVVIGNAPTALLKVMELLDAMPAAERPVVIGVPVGFVNAAESKEILAGKDYPFITSRGRKGGSPVAAAIINAILKIVKNDQTT